MVKTENVRNLLWNTTPQHKVYDWLKNANEKGYDYVVIAYNKENYNFVPIMCNDLEEAKIWISYFDQSERYSQDIMVEYVSEDTIQSIFSGSKSLYSA